MTYSDAEIEALIEWLEGFPYEKEAAVVRQLLEERRWRPISEAPKDGRSIYLTWNGDDPCSGEGFYRNGQWVVAAKFYCSMFSPPYQIREFIVDPISWVPLPTPPQDGED